MTPDTDDNYNNNNSITQNTWKKNARIAQARARNKERERER